MPTPSSGPISIGVINQNFGRGTNLNAYRNTIWYQPNSLTFGYFSGGAINLSDFYNKQPNDPAGSGAADFNSPGTYYWTVPLFRNFIQIQVWGGGGAGGPYDRNGGYAPAGGNSYVAFPGGQMNAYGGGGGQGAATDRFGGTRFGAGGYGAGSNGGNANNDSGQAGGTGDQGYGGGSPNGGGATGVDPYQEYETTGPNGNFPGGGGGGFNVTFQGKFPASSGGGGGGGYSRSVWGGGTFYGSTLTIGVGSGASSGTSVGANGRVFINWG